jgi:OOP family OmpA-OmpF porin
MKLNKLASSIALGFITLASNGVSAEATNAEGFYIGAFGEYYWADWDEVESSNTIDLGESLGGGVEFGYRFTQDWSARIEYALHSFNIEDEDSHKKIEYYGGALLYHFGDNGLYGVAGLKHMNSYRAVNMGNLGLGMRHYLADNLAVSGEVNWYEGLNETHTDISLKLGINYFFGQSNNSYTPKKAAPAQVTQVAAPEKPVDSDKDGVFDVNDNCANSPVEYAVDLKGCTVYEDKQVSVHLLVNFSNDNSDVNSQYLSDIKDVADFLNEFEQSSVRLEGHTSAQGNAAYNHKLSEQRAKAVGDVLVSKYQIDGTRISTVGFGETRLINKMNTVESHAQNRRVVANISTTQRLPVKR